MKLSFEDWVSFVFDHEVSDPEWYFDTEAKEWEGTPELTVDYLTRLFKQPMRYLGSYSDEQLNQGFWYLVSNSCSDTMFNLVNEQVPLELRLRCIRSFADLFKRLFAVKCSPHLAHSDDFGAYPLNSVCYMWWDIIPFSGQPSHGQINDECLLVMEKVLQLNSIACQESALHGLGHWHMYYPTRTERVIDAFLASHPKLRPELLNYAKVAQCGCVQ